MKKLIAILMAAVIAFGTISVFASEEEGEWNSTVTVLQAESLGDLQDLLYEMPEGITVQELIDIGTKNLKVLKAYKPFIDDSIFKDLNKALSKVKKSKTVEDADAFMALWAQIIQTKPLEGNIWYLWDENNMPVLDGEELTPEDFEPQAVTDNMDYRPFVMKYLLDDPTQARGNLLINSGGERSNDVEGVPVAQLFNSLGYNCFIVNRRALPYKYEDKAMDLQRAIRMVRYYAAQEGWGGQDCIAAYGGSAGGIVILGCINALYGENTPNIFDSDYVPDELDAINSDLDAVVTVYFGGDQIEEDPGVPDYASPGFLLNEENPNWPAMFLCSGTDDNFGAHVTAQKIYDQIKDKVPSQLRLYEGAKHGFGIGTEDYPETFGWPYEADIFFQANRK